MLAPELIGELQQICPDCRILIFTAYPEHVAVTAAVNAGAHGVLVKDAAKGNLLGAISAVAAGDSPGRAPQTDAMGVITAREYDVLRRVAMGQSNPEIAESLCLTRNTVKSYMQNIFHKFDVRNRVEAIAHARNLGLL
jgi:DNA-binding NarL/FixJ family response regulator